MFPIPARTGRKQAGRFVCPCVRVGQTLPFRWDSGGCGLWEAFAWGSLLLPFSSAHVLGKAAAGAGSAGAGRSEPGKRQKATPLLQGGGQAGVCLGGHGGIPHGKGPLRAMGGSLPTPTPPKTPSLSLPLRVRSVSSLGDFSKNLSGALEVGESGLGPRFPRIKQNSKPPSLDGASDRGTLTFLTGKQGEARALNKCVWSGFFPKGNRSLFASAGRKKGCRDIISVIIV